MDNSTLKFLGVAYGNGAGDPGCADGPVVLAESIFLNELARPVTWVATHRIESRARGLDAMSAICQLNLQVATDVAQIVLDGHHFVTVGGDQTCSLGTWSGASAAVDHQLGLIWVDAHMDAHTPLTTPSGNIHGMPLAALLGYGDASMTELYETSTKLKPENVVLIGIRSYEPEEAELLKRIGLRVYYMPEIHDKGIATVMQEACDTVTKNTSAYGICIDMDGIDPSDAPGVGTPEPDGIAGTALCEALLRLANDDKLIGAEIVEFNPHKDQQQKTEQLIIKLINALFPNKESS